MHLHVSCPHIMVAITVVAIVVIVAAIMVCGRHGLWPSWLNPYC